MVWGLRCFVVRLSGLVSSMALCRQPIVDGAAVYRCSRIERLDLTGNV